MSGYRIFWGDSHNNTHAGPDTGTRDPSFERILKEASVFTDFHAAAYYTCLFPRRPLRNPPDDGREWQGIMVECAKPAEQIAREWSEVEEVTRALNADGKFVTFPGYEWHGNGKWGDFNVCCREEGHPVHMVDTLAELYGRLRGAEAIAVPHHLAYHTGRRAPDWKTVDEHITPFAEIFSGHGCSETDEEWVGLRANIHMGPAVMGSTYHDALRAGLHIGAVCAPDGWYPAAIHGRGLMAVLAEELTRASLWRAFRARRVYGVTGDRIKLDFTLNGAPMGSIIEHAAVREIAVSITGADALDRIELLRNGRVIYTHTHQDMWEIPPVSQRTRFKLRIACGWGPRPNEIPPAGTAWQGELHVEGGRMLGWEPCWVTPGQAVPRIEIDRARFTLDTPAGAAVPNADIFEFEAVPESAVTLKLNGLEMATTVRELCEGSRILWYKDECRQHLKALTGLDLRDDERNDVYYATARKAKVHKCIPKSGFTVNFDIEDDEDVKGETSYRIRVEQRNGQRAWSSPIWVKNKAT